MQPRTENRNKIKSENKTQTKGKHKKKGKKGKNKKQNTVLPNCEWSKDSNERSSDWIK